MFYIRNIFWILTFEFFFIFCRFLVKNRYYSAAQSSCRMFVDKDRERFFFLNRNIGTDISSLGHHRQSKLARLVISMGEIEYGCNVSILKDHKSYLDFLNDTSLRQRVVESEGAKEIADMIKGKSTCIIGPAETGNTAVEIEKHDLVGRVGYSGDDSCANGSGNRVDFSFYAGHKLKGMKQKELLDEVSGLRFAIVKSPDFAEFSPDVADRTVLFKSIVSQDFRKDFLGFHPNATQDLIINLICFEPSKIMIGNMDLFLTPVYPSGYITNRDEHILQRNKQGWRLPNVEMARSFGNHNPAAHYRFMKELLDRGYIEVDSHLKGVLEMSEASYIKTIDELYGVDFL